MRCTNATLKAFGIEVSHDVIHGAGVVSLLQRNGYSLEVPSWWDDRAFSQPKLSEFIAAHPTGSYVVVTANHSMALIDGRLIDTANGTGRRVVKYVYRVTC